MFVAIKEIRRSFGRFALLTLAVALGAGHLRAGLADRIGGAAGLRTMAAVEVMAGALVALVAGQLVLRLI